MDAAVPKPHLVPGNEGQEPLQLETEQLTERDQGLGGQRRRIDVSPTETFEFVRRESQDPRDSRQGLSVPRQHALQDLAQPITCAWAASFEERSGTLADATDLVGISPEGIERAFVEWCQVSPFCDSPSWRLLSPAVLCRRSMTYDLSRCNRFRLAAAPGRFSRVAISGCVSSSIA